MCCTTCTVVLVLISRPGNPIFFFQLSQVYFKHCLKYIHYMVLFVYTYKSKVDFLSFKMVQVNMPCDAYRVWNRLEVLQLWRWEKTLWCHRLQFIVQCTHVLVVCTIFFTIWAILQADPRGFAHFSSNGSSKELPSGLR